jgi:hypothetical protein
MLLILGKFVYRKLKSGRVQKLALAVVLNWDQETRLRMPDKWHICKEGQAGNNKK